jgi:signal transduction histidine kinase
VSADSRVEQLLEALQEMAGGDLERRVPISPAHDELDAIAHGVNVLVGELRYTAAGLRRAKLEAEASSQAKSNFLRNISHEIRTPLSAILGLARLLDTPPSGASDDRRHELLARLVSNGQVLLALVDDLLDLSKVEASRLDFESRAVAPLEVVAAAIANLQSEADRKGLGLSIEPVGVVPTILTDGRRLSQILTNLIGNAIKFTERGAIRVRVSASTDGERLEIAVVDTGMGLTAAQAEALFSPFQQGDASIARRFGGTGLGLALSRRLAEGLGGTVELAGSAPGAGSTFRVSLPARRAEAPPPSRAPVAPPRPGELAGVRLLLADDNEDIREPIVELLELLGAQVIEAEDGHTAMRLALEGQLDVVLMDVRMPDLDGLEVTRRLRRAGARVPIIALTADAVEEHRQECLAAGCDDYVTKPVELARLVEAVKRVRGAIVK